MCTYIHSALTATYNIYIYFLAGGRARLVKKVVYSQLFGGIVAPR